jgi:hypothetical protein
MGQRFNSALRHGPVACNSTTVVSVLVSYTPVRDRSPRSPGSCPRRSRTAAAGRERRSALLESVLGATPREFESRILRDAGLRRCEHGARAKYPPGVLARSQFWSQLRVSAQAVPGVTSRCCAWSRRPRTGLNKMPTRRRGVHPAETPELSRDRSHLQDSDSRRCYGRAR